MQNIFYTGTNAAQLKTFITELSIPNTSVMVGTSGKPMLVGDYKATIIKVLDELVSYSEGVATVVDSTDRILIIAKDVTELINDYGSAIGSTPNPSWDDSSSEDQALTIASVKAALLNSNPPPSLFHDAWVARNTADGVAMYVPPTSEAIALDPNAAGTGNPNMVAFGDLPANIAAKGNLFNSVVAIRGRELFKDLLLHLT